MSELGEDFKAHRQWRQEKRARNREASARLLTEAGIKFQSHSSGAHLIVDGRVDFWPGTGLWIQRGTSSRQRGVDALIRFIRATDSAVKERRP